MDATRVVKGQKQRDNEIEVLLDPLMELTFTKTAEMFSEAIPSSILQTYALIKAKRMTETAAFSIFISAVSIGFSSVSISIDMDTDPTKRLKNPEVRITRRERSTLTEQTNE